MRDIESLAAIFAERGLLDKKRTTKKLIATFNVVSVQVLHALLQSFKHFMKVVVHIHAHVFEWSESKLSCYNRFLTASK